MKHTVCSLALLLLVQTGASAGPGAPAATPTKAVPAKAAPAKGTPPATPAPLSPEDEAAANFKTELRRLMVGNQAGIVKILGPNREGVAYSRCIDDRNWAPLSDETCQQIFAALGLESKDLPNKMELVMSHFGKLPRKEAVAFLSAAAWSKDMQPELRQKAEEFLVQVMETDKDVHARRQAILALAVQPRVSADTAERVIALYERCENLWETFPVQQFCQYHAGHMRHLKNFPELRQRVAAVNSLYTPAILNYLDHP